MKLELNEAHVKSQTANYRFCKVELFNYVLTLFRANFACNLAFKNLVFRWE